MDSAETKAHRAALRTELESIAERHSGNANVLDFVDDGRNILRILKSFHETRMDAPELNLCLVDAMGKLCGCYYFKNRLLLESAEQLMNVFKVTENIAAFSTVSMEVCVNIIAAFIHAGQMPKARSWLKVLKIRATLVFGTWTVIYSRFPSTVNLMQQFCFDL